MSEVAERFPKVAAGFSARARAVPPDGWDRPAPCEGWVARDVVGHLVGWMPPLLFAGVQMANRPRVADDPAGAWQALADALQKALDDPEAAARPIDVQGNSHTLESAVAAFGIGDVLVHTWDLARATGLDETLDPAEVHLLFEHMKPNDALLRSSDHFGPRVEVPDDADEQTQLLAFTGRRP